jgi:hypothetical protein
MAKTNGGKLAKLAMQVARATTRPDRLVRNALYMGGMWSNNTDNADFSRPVVWTRAKNQQMFINAFKQDNR